MMTEILFPAKKYLSGNLWLNTGEKQKTQSHERVSHKSLHQPKYLSKLLSSFY